MQKELIYEWATFSLMVLVPKRRGTGYCKVPLGHHENTFFRHLSDDLNCDINGLDGNLVFECGGKISCYPDERKEYINRVMPRLSEYYKMTYRESRNGEFWKLHPDAPK